MKKIILCLVLFCLVFAGGAVADTLSTLKIQTSHGLNLKLKIRLENRDGVIHAIGKGTAQTRPSRCFNNIMQFRYTIEGPVGPDGYCELDFTGHSYAAVTTTGTMKGYLLKDNGGGTYRFKPDRIADVFAGQWHVYAASGKPLGEIFTAKRPHDGLRAGSFTAHSEPCRQILSLTNVYDTGQMTKQEYMERIGALTSTMERQDIKTGVAALCDAYVNHVFNMEEFADKLTKLLEG